MHSAAHALEHGEVEDAEHHLEEAAKVASGEQLDLINQALEALKKGDIATASQAVEKIQSSEGGEHDQAGDEHNEEVPGVQDESN